MTIKVLYFAALREKMNRSEDVCEIHHGDTPSTLAQRLFGASANILFAINDEFASADCKLQDGDHLAFIPPMAGG